MKNKEVNKLSKDELINKINSLKKDLFNFRFRKINGQIEDTSKVSQIRRDVAKLLTKLNLSFVFKIIALGNSKFQPTCFSRTEYRNMSHRENITTLSSIFLLRLV